MRRTWGWHLFNPKRKIIKISFMVFRTSPEIVCGDDIVSLPFCATIRDAPINGTEFDINFRREKSAQSACVNCICHCCRWRTSSPIFRCLIRRVRLHHLPIFITRQRVFQLTLTADYYWKSSWIWPHCACNATHFSQIPFHDVSAVQSQLAFYRLRPRFPISVFYDGKNLFPTAHFKNERPNKRTKWKQANGKEFDKKKIQNCSRQIRMCRMENWRRYKMRRSMKKKKKTKKIRSFVILDMKQKRTALTQLCLRPLF